MRLERDGSRAEFVNDLPVPVLVSAADSVTGRHATIAIAAHGRVSAESFGTALRRFDVADPAIGLRIAAPAQCGRPNAASLTAAIASLERELAAPGMEGTAQASQLIELGTQVAQLKYESIRDSIDVSRNSSLALTLRLQNRPTSSSEIAKQRDDDTKEFIQQTGEDIAYAALAYSDMASAKLEVLRRDEQHYKKLLDQSEASLRAVRAQLTRLAAAVSAYTEFTRQLANTIDGAPSPRSGDVDGASARRLCDAPAEVDDEIELTMSAPTDRMSAVVEARFDSRARQSVVFRRVRGTNTWRGTIAWPIDARDASLRARLPGTTRWRDVRGTISGRTEALTALERRLVDDVNKARARYKDGEFRAAGSDYLKTITPPLEYL